MPIRAENSRSIGVADMAYAMRTGRAHRANGEMAYHVLDIMHAVHDASKTAATSALKAPASAPRQCRSISQ